MHVLRLGLRWHRGRKQECGEDDCHGHRVVRAGRDTGGAGRHTGGAGHGRNETTDVGCLGWEDPAQRWKQLGRKEELWRIERDAWWFECGPCIAGF